MDQPQQQPSTTTVEQNLRTAGQRRINLIWEYTQAAIALTAVLANILIFVFLFVKDVTMNATTAAVLLSNAFFLVIGFYFGRTNHARIGDEIQTLGDRSNVTLPMDDRR